MFDELHNGTDQLIKMAGCECLRNCGKCNRIERDQKIYRIELGNLALHVLPVSGKTGLDFGSIKEIAGQKAAEHEEKVDSGDCAEPLGIIEKIPVPGMQHIDVEESKRAQKLHLV